MNEKICKALILLLVMGLLLAGCEAKTSVSLAFGAPGEDGYAWSDTEFVSGGSVTVSAGAGVVRAELVFVPVDAGKEVGPLTLEQRKTVTAELTPNRIYRVGMKKDGAAAEITVTGVNVKTA